MKRFKNILLFTGTVENEAAISRSITLAMENDANLTLIDVIKPIPRALGMLTDVAESAELQELVVKDHRQKLLKIAGDYLDTGIPIDVVVAVGDPSTEIVRQVLAGGHDLVVKTADGVSSVGRFFGSIARSLLRICPCPVWILKPEIHGQFDCVLAAVDLEAADQAHKGLNRNIMEIAFSIAQREEAQLHIVSAWDLWMEQSLRRRAGDAEVDAALARHEKKVRRALDELLQGADEKIDDYEVHLHRGNSASVIRLVADRIDADLMVMGTVCRTGAAGFLIGNTAETVLAEVTCSILAMKPEGFISPVQMAEEEMGTRSADATAH